jgi:thiol:disulfide interchange protein DsbD
MANVQDQSNRFKWIRAVAGTTGLVLATLLIGSWILRGPGITWQPYSDDLLENARRNGKPVIVDFYADWCSPCVKLENETFHQSDIVARTRKDIIMVKVDLTRADNLLNEDLLTRYKVKGVPTVVFIGPDGRERNDLRLVDFIPADQFLDRMALVTKSWPRDRMWPKVPSKPPSAANWDCRRRKSKANAFSTNCLKNKPFRH